MTDELVPCPLCAGLVATSRLHQKCWLCLDEGGVASTMATLYRRLITAMRLGALEAFTRTAHEEVEAMLRRESREGS